MSYFQKLKAFLLAYKWYVLAALVVVITGAAIWRMNGAETTAEASGPREVRVATVHDLMTGGSSLSTVAEVRSVNEAKINTEASGRITRITAELGDSVGAGQIIAEIENGSQRAAVLQAEGALDAAKASAGGAQESAVSTLLSAYGAIDSAIEDAVGQIYTNPENSAGGFAVSTRDTQALADMENVRSRMSDIVRRESAQVSSITESSAASELPTVEGELREVRAYLDTVLKVLNAAVPREDMPNATIGGYIADVTAARSAVNSSLSSVISTRTSVEGSGAVSSSAAQVKQAEGAYNAALANLEKTRIRSPIAGTLNNFTLKLGDFVAPSQQVAIVSNNGSLEAVAYVTDEDRNRIAVGAQVTIEGNIEGTITKIAPALDPVTRRIEVRIGLPRTAAGELTNGQSVRVELIRSEAVATNTSEKLTVPITALKMEANRSLVFSVDGDNKLVAKEVTTGTFSGSSIEITAGLAADDEIVADARGLKEGDIIVPIR